MSLHYYVTKKQYKDNDNSINHFDLRQNEYL